MWQFNASRASSCSWRRDHGSKRSQIVLPTGTEGQPARAEDRTALEIRPMAATKKPMGSPVGGATASPDRRDSSRRSRSRKGGQATIKPPKSKGSERQGKRQRTEREVWMVTAPSDTHGVPGEELREVMENGTFEDEKGKWMRETLYALLNHPQVRQYYDELRCMVRCPNTWREVEHRFNEILVDKMDEED